MRGGQCGWSVVRYQGRSWAGGEQARSVKNFELAERLEL